MSWLNRSIFHIPKWKTKRNCFFSEILLIIANDPDEICRWAPRIVEDASTNKLSCGRESSTWTGLCNSRYDLGKMLYNIRGVNYAWGLHLLALSCKTTPGMSWHSHNLQPRATSQVYKEWRDCINYNPALSNPVEQLPLPACLPPRHLTVSNV